MFVSLLDGREHESGDALLRNTVMGVEGQWDFWQERMALKGEIYQSQSHTALDSLLGPARAGQVEARGQWDAIHLEGYGRYAQISPFYYSPGAPFLIRDRERYEFRLRQRLLKGRLHWQAQLKRDRDNLLPIKFARTTVSSASFSLGWRPAKGPYIQAQYAPFFRENNRTDSLRDRQYLQVVGIQSSYTYTLGSFNLSSNLSLNQQISRNLQPERDFSTLSATFTQSMTFRQPLSFFLSLSYLGAAYYSDQNENPGSRCIRLVYPTSQVAKHLWCSVLGRKCWRTETGRLLEEHVSYFPLHDF